jgi:hypothetical protein
VRMSRTRRTASSVLVRRVIRLHVCPVQSGTNNA